MDIPTIHKELAEHNRIMRIVAEKLGAFVFSEGAVKSLLRALELVREALDEKGKDAASEIRNRDRLFQAEAILAAELGEPVWKGHDFPGSRDASPKGAR